MQNNDFKYKFYLDGNEVPNPDGWDEMVTTIKRDRDLKGVFVTMEGSFLFEDKGYDYLYNQFFTSGYCADIALKIEESRDNGGTFKEFYDGIIKISDVIFDKKYKTAQTKVLDNSFFAHIYNNRNLSTKVIAGKSKNNIDITPPTIHDMSLFSPADGSIVTGAGHEAWCYKAYDLFKYLVEFMTDGEVAFDSTLFGVGGDREFTMLTFGKAIRKVQQGYTQSLFKNENPDLTFLKLFKELDHRENLGIFVQNVKGKPTLKIERWDDLFNTTTSATISNIDRIKERISTDDIYSTLKIGGGKGYESFSTGAFPESIRFMGFNKEEYTIVGKCNVDRILDLSGEFIVNTNVIREILIENTADTSFDSDWFIIDAYYSAGHIAKASNWLDDSTPVVYYNEYYTNKNIALRYLKAVPNSIAQFLGNGNDEFKASRTTFRDHFIYPLISVSNAGFSNDYNGGNFDPNNNYGNGTPQGTPVSIVDSRYTCPEVGFYVFEFHQLFGVNRILEANYSIPFVSNNNIPFTYNEIINGASSSLLYGTGNFIYQSGVNSGILYYILRTGGFDNASQISGSSSGSISQANNNPTLLSPQAAKGIISVYLKRYDSLGTLLSTDTITKSIVASGTIALDLTKGFIANQGDYFEVSYDLSTTVAWIGIDIQSLPTSYFACINSSTGGGIFQTYNPADYPVIKDDFEIEFSSYQFDNIKNNPLSIVEFSHESHDHAKAWCDSIRFNHRKQLLTASLLSSVNSR